MNVSQCLRGREGYDAADYISATCELEKGNMETVADLTAQKLKLEDRIFAIGVGARSGKADELAGVNMQDLARQAKALDIQIERARAEEAEAEAKRVRAEHDSRREQLEMALTEAAKQKQLFADLYRQAALALGSYCSNMESATALANATATRLGLDVVVKNRLQALNTNLDPLPALRDAGYKAPMGFGWNINCLIVPLMRLQESESNREGTS